jgi:uncharacterized protein
MKPLPTRQALVIYYLLAVIVTAVAVLPIILSTQRIIPNEVSPNWHPLGALGPIGAALVVVYLALGRQGLAAYIKSLIDTRFSAKLFLLAVSPLLIFPILLMIVPFFGVQIGQEVWQLSFAWWINMLIASIAYGIGEEAGWRGFALPRLQGGMNALWATIVLTVFHALWHIPFFYYRLHFDVGTAIGFFIGMLAGALFMAYLYNESGGKTLLPILFHTTWNIVSQLALATVPETTYIMSTLLMIAAGLVVIVLRPTNLATRSRWTIHDEIAHGEAHVGQTTQSMKGV